MKDVSEAPFQSEIEELRARLQEAEETLHAIQSGEVDALVVSEQVGRDRVYTLKSPDRPYRLMIEEMAQGAVTLTPNGLILYCNAGFARMLKRPIGEIVGSSLDGHVTRGSRDLLDALLHQREGAQSEIELATVDGALVPVYVTLNALPLDDGDGQPVLCLVVTDLAEQKRNERIVADEKLARSILDHAAEATVVCDTAGRVLRASSEAHRLCGRNPLLEPFAEVFPLDISSPEIPDTEALLRRTLSGQRVSGLEAVLDCGRLDVMLSAGPLWGVDHGIDGCVVTFTDITTRRNAEREMKRAWAAAEAMNEAKDRFLATLSHELRTPLTPVLAVISGLEMGDRLPEDLRQDMAMMRRNIELEARLIDDLLDLTRVSRGKLELQLQEVDLRQVLEHAIQTSCGEGVAAGHLRVVADLENGRRLWADAPRLTQVFWNLLNNAVKFTPQGGTVTVRSWTDASGWLTAEVTDTGIGIEPELLTRIFDAFEQGEPGTTRRFGGLGLGLAISKTIAELHGGSLQALSEGPGRGSTFRVRLPLTPVPAHSAVPETGGEPPARDDKPLRLLLVEDHSDTAAAMAELLRCLGHDVTVAHSVAEGLATADEIQSRAPSGTAGIDLVLSDLGLPDASGLDLMRELAQRYGLRGIALSGYGMEEDLRRSREAGFTRHLTKPVDLESLRAAIQQVAGS